MIKILLVGCGHMGSALLTKWIRNKRYSLSVIDPIKYNNLKKKFPKKAKFYKTINDIKDIDKFNIIVFAIKPQIAQSIIKQYSFFSDDKTLYISIIAGKKIKFFQKILGNKTQILRVMPNMPAIIGLGMSCLYSNHFVKSKNKKISEELFNKVGKTMWLRKESEIDKITSISGSGPAYYFLFIECLETISKNMGFSSVDAEKLVHQTALGSINLLLHSNKSAAYLKKSIAIKGGTTEAAISILEKESKLKKILSRAVKAAYLQSINLGK